VSGRDPKESDWKQFRKIVPHLRERYLKKVNEQVAALLADSERTPTEQFWDVQERIEDEEKIIMDCFDDHRRSTMLISMAVMQRNGVLSDNDLKGFSDELREQMKVLKEL
jgi:hypothetical protein